MLKEILVFDYLIKNLKSQWGWALRGCYLLLKNLKKVMGRESENI